jgi:hypothetical protein
MDPKTDPEAVAGATDARVDPDDVQLLGEIRLFVLRGRSLTLSSSYGVQTGTAPPLLDDSSVCGCV